MGRRPGVTGALFDEMERWSGLGMGLAALATGFTRSRLVDQDGSVLGPDEPVTLADLLRVLPGAAASVAAAVESVLFDVVAQVEDRVNRASGVASQVVLTGPVIRSLYVWLSGLDREFQEKQQERAELAAEFLAEVGPEATAELLSRVDMNMVLSDVDMDALVDRVTVDRVMDKVDVNGLMSEIIAELDATGLLRESTGAIAATTVGTLRNQVGTATRIAGRVVRRPGT
jgi:hypothetical protein